MARAVAAGGRPVVGYAQNPVRLLHRVCVHSVARVSTAYFFATGSHEIDLPLQRAFSRAQTPAASVLSKPHRAQGVRRTANTLRPLSEQFPPALSWRSRP